MARPPRLVGVAEVEIAQRTADGDLADRVEVAERGRLLLELDNGARHLALLEHNVGLAALVLRQGELVPAGLRRIEDAVGQRLLCGAVWVSTPASAQQVTGTPGSPGASTTIDGRYLPPPPQNFIGCT